MRTFGLAILAALGCGAVAMAAPDAGTAGPPPLTPAMVDDFIIYNEYVLDTRVTLAQRADLKAVAEKAWGAKNAKDQALLMQGVAGKADLANFSDAEKASLRPSVEDEHLKAMRKRAKELQVAAWVVLVAESRKALVPGDPPLSRQSADALAEVMAFVVGEAGGGKIALAADKPFRDAFTKALTDDYAGYDDEQKAALADLPKDWATLRTGYPAYPEDKKQKLKKEWAEAIVPLLADSGVLAADAKPLRDAAKALSAKVIGWL